jgi:adenine-specific DNA-methyltransferase
MQLNAEDGGNRKFIMVQLDESTNPDSDARKAGYKTIDEISRERIKRAAKKIQIRHSELISESPLLFQEIAGLTRNDGNTADNGFKHYRLISPTVETLDKIMEFSTEDLFSVDMVSELGGLETILTTWLVDSGNTFDTKVEEIILKDRSLELEDGRTSNSALQSSNSYIAQYIAESKTLYLISEGFNTEALKAMLNKIGTGELPVSSIVVYPYSFGFEIMRELEIGVKSLDNASQIIKNY